MQTLRYPVDSKPPFGLTLLLALQHLLAALGGIIAIPLVIGNVLKLPTPDTIVLVNAALLVSGIVTIIQCRGIGPIGLRLPSVIGTSFTFVAAALAIGFSEHGVAGILGASLVGSLIMVIGSFFMPYVRKLFPPVVTGVVVMMIGLSLIPSFSSTTSSCCTWWYHCDSSRYRQCVKTSNARHHCACKCSPFSFRHCHYYSMPRDWPYRFAFAKRNRYQFYVRSSRTGNWF